MRRLNLRWIGGTVAVVWLLFAVADPTQAPSGPVTKPTAVIVTEAGRTARDAPFPTFSDDGWAPARQISGPESPLYMDASLIQYQIIAAARREAVIASRGEAQRLERQESVHEEALVEEEWHPEPAAPYTPPAPPEFSGALQWPITDSYVSSGFGWRDGVMHEGIDLPQQEGYPIMAAAAGVVIQSGWDGGYGYSILIDHGSGIVCRYSHASQLLVGVGEQVAPGQTIALVGNTGHSYGNHLHFEVIVDGIPRNPLAYLP